MTARPVTGWHGANMERNTIRIAGVESRPADFAESPAGTKIARSHFSIGLEAAGSEHHAPCLDFNGSSIVLHAHAVNAVIVGDQRESMRVVGNRYAVFHRDFCVRLDEARAAAPGFDRESAPEFEFTVDLVGLSAIDGDETNAFLLHPAHRVFASCDQKLA